MNLSEGDKLVKDTKTWRVELVCEKDVMLEGGEWVDKEQIQEDIKHDRTRVFYND